MAPSVDGDPNDTLLFNSKYLEDAHGIDLNLKKSTVGPGGSLWLRYTIEN